MKVKKFRSFSFSLFNCKWDNNGQWWVDVAELEIGDWTGSLFYLCDNYGQWQWELCYLRQLILETRA